MKAKAASLDVDGYIAEFPAKVQAILKKVRQTVRKAAPEAEERISYRMPAFFQNGVVIYFAAFKNHIGVFPPVRGDAKLVQAIVRYRGPKGNLKFPLDKPMPYGLIERIVKSRLKENNEKAKAKSKKRKSNA